MPRRGIVAALAATLALAAAAALLLRPDRALRVATGFVAHVVCSKSFVSGFDPQVVFAETTEREGVRILRPLLRFHVDRNAGIVDSSILGLFESRAAFHDGLGCVMLFDGVEPYVLRSDLQAVKAAKAPPLLPEIAGEAVVEPSDPALKAMLDHAFAEPETPPFRRTKAVVVVRDGRIIAERYASGIGAHTPLMGFSLTKSVVSALIGIMTQQGLTSPSIPAPIAEWRSASDPRREIEVEHLLRMTTGLDLDETNSGFDASSRMLLLHNDMAAFAVKARPIAPPGTRWAYSSPSTQLLARIIREATGGPEQSLAYAWRELFNPLGMRDVTLEFDGAGTLQASTYMFASARDWARFGLLYLNDGVVGGNRILHEDWVDFSAAATLDTDYGAGFWTNRTEHGLAPLRARHPARCVLCLGRSRPAHRHHSLAAHGGGAARRFRRSHRRHAWARTTGQGSDRGDAELDVTSEDQTPWLDQARFTTPGSEDHRPTS
ncbi:serine hydrolase [Bradyrhizobium sp. NP1]|uniref:serine hydrolase domain-containing protein n=1 Tax=Bradyrhizobium sp. NP1 TaxID=3049772 RepID=UPI0025A4FADA|nr:serine hydrolase [Bradyrhizobium sp. NP1]WJR78479.1 serine hydrolase [Bradyrhizobium sp. NP1]